MSFVPYKPSSKAWNNIQGQVYGKSFYPIQTGSGGKTNIQVVSPAQGSVQRAKLDLKRQLSQSNKLPVKRKKATPKTRKKGKPKAKKKPVKKKIARKKK